MDNQNMTVEKLKFWGPREFQQATDEELKQRIKLLRKVLAESFNNGVCMYGEWYSQVRETEYRLKKGGR